MPTENSGNHLRTRPATATGLFVSTGPFVSTGLVVVTLLVSGCGSGATPVKGVGGPGQQTFTTKCGGCHTLAAAGTHGSAGPNLDALAPDKARVLAAIKNGGTGGGVMPKNFIQGAQAEQVAAFVAASAGRK